VDQEIKMFQEEQLPFSLLSSISDRLPFSCNGNTARDTTSVEYLWKQGAQWR